MPTGYTADLYAGKPITFEQFVWQNARAFGALILMRDDPHDAPIPGRFEPSDYHTKALLDAEEALIDLRAMTAEQMTEAYMRERAEVIASRAKDVRKRRDLRLRYEAMLEQVEAWEPPTPDHRGLKEHMRDQLQKSIDHDCGGGAYPPMPPDDPAAWWEAKLERAEWSVNYHRQQRTNEIERTEERNAWVDALRASLAPRVKANQ